MRLEVGGFTLVKISGSKVIKAFIVVCVFFLCKRNRLSSFFHKLTLFFGIKEVPMICLVKMQQRCNTKVPLSTMSFHSIPVPGVL